MDGYLVAFLVVELDIFVVRSLVVTCEVVRFSDGERVEFSVGWDGSSWLIFLSSDETR